MCLLSHTYVRTFWNGSECMYYVCAWDSVYLVNCHDDCMLASIVCACACVHVCALGMSQLCAHNFMNSESGIICKY